ncbi:MAG TPA: hypothetical protein VFE14_16945 [Micromonosporaceae bacterium]|nr:hypothetical protein [Micromonosporaceae bacterium]
MNRPPMTRDEVDLALVALVAGYDRIAAGMFALDSHAGLAFLRRGTVTGRTAQVGRDVQARTDTLWAQFNTVKDRLERAQTIRVERSRPGPDELTELTGLLRERSIRLAASGVPLDETATGPPAETLTVAELARRLESANGEVVAALDQVDAACAALANRLAPTAEALAAAQASAESLGAGAGPLGKDLDRLRARLTEATDAALADPLSTMDTGALDRIGTELTTTRDRLAELARVRTAYPQGIAELDAAVSLVAKAEDDAGRSYATALAKIAEPGLPAAPSIAGALRGRVAGLEPLAAAGRWAQLADELAAVQRDVAAGQQRADALRAAADGLLARRTELRGRLDAYRAKAARSGFTEDTELSDLHRQAQELLYTSPCDLPAATRAVLRYQRRLAERAGTTPGLREPT